jgi:3',5'-cyclic AMP phosphodiesterase CpdA
MPDEWTKLGEGEIAIAHLSDLHVGSPKWEDSWLLVKQCLIDAIKPSLILVTGDLVHTPRADWYKKARTELDSLAQALGPVFGLERIPYFVCAGNHDRYWLGNRPAFSALFPRRFKLLSTAVLAVVCVALWVASWPSLTTALWVSPAPLALILSVWVLPTFLDWMWDIVTRSERFDGVFSEHILRPTEAREVALSRSTSSRWTIGLFGTDSSVGADSSARGWINRAEFREYGLRTRGSTWDLCVFLVHHHVLPVRQLESKRKDKPADLFNLTCLVNSGSLLETLADAHVDLVLHGHEHEYNWGAYGSLGPGSGKVRVLAAGSATGNSTATGCATNDATFNVIILTPNRSGRLRRLRNQAHRWEVQDDLVLFSSSEIRSGRAHRAKENARREILGEVVKFVEYTRSRDVMVHWFLKNWFLTDRFAQDVLNSTGILTDVKAALIDRSGAPLPVDARSERVGDNKWRISWNVPPTHQNTPLTVELRYSWRGGGALTKAELDAIRAGPAPGPLRQDGYEWETVWAPAPVAAAELFLVLPAEYAPAVMEVRVSNQVTQEVYAAEAAELLSNCHPLEVGVYSFRVPFPHIERDYTLAWRPVKSEGDGPGAAGEYGAFADAAQNRGRSLLDAFASVFAESPWDGHMSLSLYQLERSTPPTAVRVASTHTSPERIPLVGDRSAMAQAWWGVPIMIPTRPPDVEARQMGFIDGEVALLCLPLRFSFDWTNPPPWGVVRIGIMEKGGNGLLDEPEKLWTFLSRATMTTLALALTGTG